MDVPGWRCIPQFQKYLGEVGKMKPCGNETKIGMMVPDLVDECERKHVSV